MTCSTEVDLGAYALDALEPDHADQVREHLSWCRTCQDELSSLSGTVAWLSLLSPDELEGLEELHQIGGGQARPRRRTLALVLAGGVAAAVLVGAGAVRATHDHRAAPTSAAIHAVDPGTHVKADLTISAQDSGTRLGLSLRGVPAHGWCSLMARSRDGRSETAATWVADAGGSADVTGTTAIARDQLTELDVVTDTGRLLVRIPAAPPTTDHASTSIRRTL
jgi:hypothetical protein